MTWVLRILLIGIIAASGAGFYFAKQLKQGRDDLNSQLVAEKKTSGDLSSKLAANQKDLEKTKVDLKDTAGKLDAAKEDVEAKKKQIASEMAERQKVEEKIKEVSKEKDGVQAELEKYKKALPPDMTIEQVQSKLKEFQDQLAALDKEKNILQEQLAKFTEEKRKNEEAQRLLKEGKGLAVSGHVVAVNADWNFVVLDIGAKQGLIEQVDLIVCRGDKLVGKIRVASVEPSISIADILPEWKQEDIQEGDKVVSF